MNDARLPGSDRRVLLVEDDHALRQSLYEVIEEAGYRVDCAQNGSEALAVLDAVDKPCVILLDLMMPVMNGWEFREEQVRHAHLSDIPVVVLTADGRAEMKAKTLGADAYLPKPIELSRLFELLDRFGC